MIQQFLHLEYQNKTEIQHNLVHKCLQKIIHNS